MWFKFLYSWFNYHTFQIDRLPSHCEGTIIYWRSASIRKCAAAVHACIKLMKWILSSDDYFVTLTIHLIVSNVFYDHTFINKKVFNLCAAMNSVIKINWISIWLEKKWQHNTSVYFHSYCHWNKHTNISQYQESAPAAHKSI